MGQISLVDVYSYGDGTASAGHIQFLHDLLAERKVSESISHKRHPTLAEHDAFVRSRPYLAWYIIVASDGQMIGSCYITKYREVGIWLLPIAQGKGAGSEAMRMLLALHPGRVYTNTSIHNRNAFKFYERCGFRHCANMLEHDNDGSQFQRFEERIHGRPGDRAKSPDPRPGKSNDGGETVTGEQEQVPRGLEAVGRARAMAHARIRERGT